MATKISLGARVVQTQPLVGAERDEIADLVMRIKRADERSRKLDAQPDSRKPVVNAVDRKWAEDWQLPNEVFEYFVLEHAA